MSEDETTAWKNYYLAKGLPETMLDEMIAEANEEWISELQYSPYDRYASLNVLINDLDSTSGCFYLITVQRGDWVFQGKATLELEWLFAEVPTVEVVVQVFKLKYTGILTQYGKGYAIFNHTKDDSVTVDVYPILFAGAVGGLYDFHPTLLCEKAHHSTKNVYPSLVVERAYHNAQEKLAQLSTPTLGTSQVLDGLVGMWHLDEGTGIIAYDSSPYGNNGELLPFGSEPSWVTGKFGHALSFNGTNRVQISHSSSLNILNEITLSFWFKAISGNIPCFEKLLCYLIYYDGEGWIWGTTYPNGSFGINILAPDDNWHFMAYTYKRNVNQTLFLDGSEVRNESIGDVQIDSNITSVSLGKVYGEHKVGVSDETRIYARALTLDERIALYSGIG